MPDSRDVPNWTVLYFKLKLSVVSCICSSLRTLWSLCVLAGLAAVSASSLQADLFSSNPSNWIAIFTNKCFAFELEKGTVRTMETQLSADKDYFFIQFVIASACKEGCNFIFDNSKLFYYWSLITWKRKRINLMFNFWKWLIQISLSPACIYILIVS